MSRLLISEKNVLLSFVLINFLSIKNESTKKTQLISSKSKAVKNTCRGKHTYENVSLMPG